MAGADYFLQALSLWNQEAERKDNVAFRDSQARQTQENTEAQRTIDNNRLDANLAWQKKKFDMTNANTKRGLGQGDRQIDNAQTNAEGNATRADKRIDQTSRQQDFQEGKFGKTHEFNKTKEGNRQGNFDDNLDFREKSLAQDQSQFDDRLEQNQSQFDATDENADASLAQQKVRDTNRQANAEVRNDIALAGNKRVQTVFDNEKDRTQQLQRSAKLQADSQRETTELANKSRTETSAFITRANSGKQVDITKIMLGNNLPENIMNSVRPNSGKGSGIFSRLDPKTGSYLLSTKDKEGNFLPFTLDPKANNSKQLRIGKNQLMQVLSQVSNVVGQVGEQDTNGSMMSAALIQKAGLIIDDGEVITGAVHDARTDAKQQQREYVKQKAADEAADAAAKQAQDDDIRRGGVLREAGVGVEKATNFIAKDLGIFGSNLTDFYFGKKANAEDIGEQPEKAITHPKATPKVWRDFLKINAPEQDARKRAAAAKIFGDHKSALASTKPKRKEAMDLLRQAKPEMDVQKTLNFEETGTFASREELDTLNLKNNKDIIEYQTAVEELRQLQGEGEGEISLADFYTAADPILERAAQLGVPADFGKGRSAYVKQSKARFGEALSSFMVSTGADLDTLVGLEGGVAMTNMFSIMERMNYDRDVKITSLAIPYAMAMGGVDLTEDNIGRLQQYADDRDISLEQAAIEYVDEINKL